MIKKQENIENENSLAFVVFGVIITILSLFVVPIGWYIGVLIIQYTIGIFITIPVSIIYLSLIFSYIVAGGITYAISKRLIKVTIIDALGPKTTGSWVSSKRDLSTKDLVSILSSSSLVSC